MKPKFPIIIIIVLLAITSVMMVQAKEFKYDVTTNYHGTPVLIGTLITATATTDDPAVKEVQFRWSNPSEEEVFSETKPLSGGSATSQCTLTSLGDWAVHVYFLDESGNKIKTRSSSIEVVPDFLIPEVPYGTIFVMLGMFGALCVFTINKKKVIRLPRYL